MGGWGGKGDGGTGCVWRVVFWVDLRVQVGQGLLGEGLVGVCELYLWVG